MQPAQPDRMADLRLRASVTPSAMGSMQQSTRSSRTMAAFRAAMAAGYQ